MEIIILLISGVSIIVSIIIVVLIMSRLKDCTYVPENAIGWSDIYDAETVKKIDSLPADKKAPYCLDKGHCWNPSSGGAWCYKAKKK